VRFQNVEEEVLRELNLKEGEDVYVVDPKGVVIAHRNPNLVLKETVFDLPETEGRQMGLNGDDVVLAMDTIQLENLELIVVSETTYANATALAFDLTRLAAIITGITLLVSGVIVFSVVTLVVNPITKLSRVAQAIQNGDFSKRTDLKRKDEIGQFATAFNAMTDAIQKREKDLQEQADALRIATFRAKEAARVKGEFLANVSHELRTPLNAIIGFSDMLLAGMSGPLNDKQQHKLTRLNENGSRLLALINDLLDLTRIESGRMEMVEKQFSPRSLVEHIAAQMESLAIESKLDFTTTITSDVPETLLGDEKRLEQVLVNLLSNAFKFTKEGSVALSISANEAEKTWSLAVTDTGIGIPPHALNIIFEEFRQLDGSYSRAYQGSGLGLAITRNLVRMMGGKIGVKSTFGSGSTFTVVLPMGVEEPLLEAVSEAVAN
jgi:signal transduction histidine kinase